MRHYHTEGAVLDISRTQPPAELPLTLDEVKAHLRVYSAEQDADIEGLLSDATAYLDGYDGILGRSILTQSYKLYLPAFGQWRRRGARIYHDPWTRAINLPAPPLQSVTSVAYTDINGAPQTLTEGVDFTVLDGRKSQIIPTPGNEWPQVQFDNPRAVEINYVAGMAADGASLAIEASNLRRGLLLLIGHWFHNREAVVGVENRDSSTELPIGVMAVLSPYRIIPV